MNWRFLIVFFILIFLTQCKLKEKNDISVKPEKIENIAEKVAAKENLRVGTLKIGNHKEENRLLASYPITAYNFINTNEERFALDFINQFKSEFGTASNKNPEFITGIDFIQNFKIPFQSENFITFLYTRFASTGGDYNTVQSATIYDLNEKKKLTIENIFKDFESFKKFAIKVQQIAKDSLTQRLENQKNLHPEEKNQLLEDIESQVTEGTKALEKNYNSLYFTPDNQWHVIFDPNQIAPRLLGRLELQFKNEEIQAYLKPSLVEKITQTPLPIRLKSLKFEAPKANDSIDCSKENCVALTFDNGPTQFTEQLLDTLKSYNAQATFFVIGQNAEHQPDLLRRIINEDHLIGNQSFNHKDFTRISAKEIKSELNASDDLIEEITGYRPEFFRFPYGAYTPEVLKIIEKPVISYTLDSKDWKNKNVDSLVNTLSHPPKNGIILVHDINATTVKALAKALQNYRENGTRVVSLKKLLAHQKLRKNQLYFSGEKK